jgi:hypothetical protein
VKWWNKGIAELTVRTKSGIACWSFGGEQAITASHIDQQEGCTNQNPILTGPVTHFQFNVSRLKLVALFCSVDDKKYA